MQSSMLPTLYSDSGRTQSGGMGYSPHQASHGQIYVLPPALPHTTSSYKNEKPKDTFPHTPPQVHSVAGPGQVRRFHTSIRDVFLLVLSALLLSAFLAASAYLVHVKMFLPVDYWQQDGTRWLSSGGWNVLVTVIGSLLGAIVAAGISSGMKNVIRVRILSSRGLPFTKYETLCKLSMGAIEWKVGFSAIYVLALFLLVNQLSAATQAAFGTTPANTNFTTEFTLGRLNDHGPALELVVWTAVNLPYRGEFVDAMSLAVTRDNLSYITGDVNGLQQTFGGEYPVLAINPQADVIQDYLESRSFNLVPEEADGLDRYPELKRDILRASAPNKVFRPAEGFLVNSDCEQEFVSATPTVTSDGQSTFIQILPDNCPDDTIILGPFRQNTYSSFTSVGMSSFVCVNSTGPVAIHFALVNAASATVLSAYQCQIGATSALYDAYIDLIASTANTTTANAVGRDVREVNADTLYVILRWQGELLWNQPGGFGIDIFRQFFYGMEYNPNPGPFSPQDVLVLERVVSTVVGLALAKLTDLAQLNHIVNKTPWLASEEAEMSLQTSALKMHLVGSQIAWNVLPALLLIIILCLFLHRIFHRHTGDIDFADPTQVMLIGLSSPQEQHWRDCSMGRFKDEKRYREIALYYGVDPNDSDRLILSGTAGHIQSAPERGGYYL